MKRGILVVLLAVLIAVGGTAGLLVWQAQPRPRPEPVDVTLATLDLEHPPEAITIRGTAHYRGIVRQKVPGSLRGPEHMMYVFGLFDVYDTEGREIRVLVRSPFEPPPRIDYEFVELTGWLDRPAAHTIPFRTEEMLAKADYFFGDEVLVLEPWDHRTMDPADLAAFGEAPPTDPFEAARARQEAARDTDTP